MDDIRYAFATILPEEITAPHGWKWRGTGTTSVCTARLMYSSKRLYIDVFADLEGPTVKIWYDGKEILEHRRQYDWIDPLVIPNITKWLYRMAGIWGIVCSHDHRDTT